MELTPKRKRSDSFPSTSSAAVKLTRLTAFINGGMFDEMPHSSLKMNFAWLKNPPAIPFPLTLPSPEKDERDINNIKLLRNFAHGHLKVHACLVCSRAFSQVEDLYNHEKKKHNLDKDVIAEPFYCDNCDRCFVTSEMFDKHVDRHRCCRVCKKQLKSALMTEFGLELEFSDPICEGCKEMQRRACALRRGATETVVKAAEENADGESCNRSTIISIHCSSSEEEDYFNSSDSEEGQEMPEESERVQLLRVTNLTKNMEDEEETCESELDEDGEEETCESELGEAGEEETCESELDEDEEEETCESELGEDGEEETCESELGEDGEEETCESELDEDEEETCESELDEDEEEQSSESGLEEEDEEGVGDSELEDKEIGEFECK